MEDVVGEEGAASVLRDIKIHKLYHHFFVKD